MPLASSRRSSFSSEGSVNGRGRDDGSTNRRRRGSLSRQSHPSTIESTTHVSEDKIMKLRRARRPSRSKMTGISNAKNGDKENASSNAEESLLQSPTPYWKTRKDSSQFSPRETRSNKKKKKEKQSKNQSKEEATVKKLDFSSTEDTG